MRLLSFKNIYTPSKIVFENSLFRHYHYPEVLLSYDSNFLEFKRMPSFIEFNDAEAYLREFHLQNNQNHLKFCFPENEKLTVELEEYTESANYDIGFLELYGIKPKQFPSFSNDPDINVQRVSEKNADLFLELQYQQDLKYGKDFAEQKAEQYKRQLKDRYTMLLLAFYKGIPAGALTVYISNKTAEIDGFYVLESLQKKGIGSHMQKFIMNELPEKTVILVADGEDTARTMYRKQNYQYIGFKYEAQKVCKQ
ncbi:GNAT family N-acetyltransferase [Niallia sp. 03133]|uniref:GNAT family N-acetyltransferase n=1 Tax=Niallia sp. 03133 TaxID=3458060 RepID=UPI0040449E98